MQFFCSHTDSRHLTIWYHSCVFHDWREERTLIIRVFFFLHVSTHREKFKWWWCIFLKDCICVISISFSYVMLIVRLSCLQLPIWRILPRSGHSDCWKLTWSLYTINPTRQVLWDMFLYAMICDYFVLFFPVCYQ
jgi:hypothetical protein